MRDKKLGVFVLSMMTVAALDSLRGLSSNAELGMTLVFFLVIAALLFFIPSALVSAELATGWNGGIFEWVRQAFGDRWGFVAIWLQWAQAVFWFVTVLSFAAGTLGYLINPALASNALFTALVILVVYWAATLVSLRGLKLAGQVTTAGVIIGTIIPGVISLCWVRSTCFRVGPPPLPFPQRAFSQTT